MSSVNTFLDALLSKNVALAGVGIPAIMKVHSSTGNTGNLTNAINYTPILAAGIYRLSATIYCTAFTSNTSFLMAVTYAEAVAGSVSKSMTFTNSVSSTALTPNPTTANELMWTVMLINVDASGTAITVSTTGTFTFTFDAVLVLERLS